MSRAPIQPRLPQFERFEPDLERLAKLPAWERAKAYDLANLGLIERSVVEAAVRKKIASEFRRRS